MAKYGMKEYVKDREVFDPESRKEVLSDKAFAAQKRMNKVPELGKKVYQKYGESKPGVTMSSALADGFNNIGED